MFAAQEYISGKGGDFENAVLDQIRNGIYHLDIKEEERIEPEKSQIERVIAAETKAKGSSAKSKRGRMVDRSTRWP